MTSTLNYNDIKKIERIINKINTLVTIYANVFSLNSLLVNEDIKFQNESISLTNISFSTLIKFTKDPTHLDFINKVENYISDTELEFMFIERFYHDYLIIYNVQKMFAFEIPRMPIEEDLKKLNELYKKYAKNDKHYIPKIS